MSELLMRDQESATYIGTLDCIHCGLCLEHCPTYRVTGRESANPRGRLYLMRALFEGRAEPTPDLTTDLDLCLLCRACESVCPSGVRFGELMAEVRERLRRRGFVRRLLMDGILTRAGRLRRMTGLVRFYQRSGLRMLRYLLPRRLRQLEEALPLIPPARSRAPLPELTPAKGTRAGTVAFLEGCIMSQRFGDENRNTVSLLAAAGYDVLVPKGSGCCGALHAHDGALEEARELARANVKAFQSAGVAHVVTNSAGCASGMKDYAHLLGGTAAESLAAKVVDVTRFLLEHGRSLAFEAKNLSVAYDAPCHMHHGMKETTAPIEMVRRIPGLTVTPLPDSHLCCGGAGVYFLDHPETSVSVLDQKLDALEQTGATVLLTGNPGCLLQWRSGIKRRGLSIEVLHPVSLLADTVVG